MVRRFVRAMHRSIHRSIDCAVIGTYPISRSADLVRAWSFLEYSRSSAWRLRIKSATFSENSLPWETLRTTSSNWSWRRATKRNTAIHTRARNKIDTLVRAAHRVWCGSLGVRENGDWSLLRDGEISQASYERERERRVIKHHRRRTYPKIYSERHGDASMNSFVVFERRWTDRLIDRTSIAWISQSPSLPRSHAPHTTPNRLDTTRLGSRTRCCSCSRFTHPMLLPRENPPIIYAKQTKTNAQPQATLARREWCWSIYDGACLLACV